MRFHVVGIPTLSILLRPTARMTKTSAATRRVTGVACIALINVPLHVAVIRVGVLLSVAGRAGEHGIVVGIRMAIGALIPTAGMVA